MGSIFKEPNRDETKYQVLGFVIAGIVGMAIVYFIIAAMMFWEFNCLKWSWASQLVFVSLSILIANSVNKTTYNDKYGKSEMDEQRREYEE